MVKKRLLAFVLTLAVFLSLCPLPAFAATDTAGPEAQEVLPVSGMAGDDLEDAVPEFVPGVIEEDSNFVYPDYDFGGVFGDGDIDGVTKYDSRESAQSSIKNQGSNGLCWTFGTYAAVEANMKANGMGEHDFSELHMGYSTSDRSGNTAQGWDRKPGDGGHRVQSAAYLMRGTNLSGAVNESDDPYIKTILEERSLAITQSKEKSYQVQNIWFITGNEKPTANQTAAIKTYIMSNGGVGASMYWDGNATAEAGENAYWNAATASYCYKGTATTTNHLVEIAGWDDNYGKENFTSGSNVTSNGAWLVKNSWGKQWGDNGYCWISYEDPNFPMNTFCIDGVKANDPSQTVYETDYKPDSMPGVYGSNVHYFAKAFRTETAGETLKSVRIMINQPALVNVSCVKRAQLGDITMFGSSNLGFFSKFQFDGLLEEDVQAPYSGWYTIDVPDAELGEAGEFIIIVRLSSISGENEPLYMWRDSSNTTPDDTAYVGYRSGDRDYLIFEAGTGKNKHNLCIKAVTAPGTDTDQTIAGKAAAELTWDMIKNENTSESLVCTGLALPTSWKYGTTVSWSSSRPDAISSGGTVSAGSGAVSVTLTATVTKGSAKAVKTFALTVPGIPDEMRAVADSITWDSIKGSNSGQDAVTSALSLTRSSGNVTVEWASSHDAIIDPSTGAVTRPRFDKKNDVTLTATVSSGGVRKQVTIPVTVTNAERTVTDVLSASNEWFVGDWNGNWWPLICGENEKMNAIRHDLVVPESFEVPMEKGGTFTFDVRQAKATDSAHTSQEWKNNAVTNKGAVTRPDYPQANATGYFFLGIYNEANGYIHYTTSALLTVLAYQGTVSAGVEDAVVTAEDITEKLTANVTQAGRPGALSYQWYKCESADAARATAIDGATGADFAIPAGLTAGKHYYYCEVSGVDAKAANSNVATVTVLPPPVKLTEANTRITLEIGTGLTYTGQQIRPGVAVTVDGQTLAKDKDYTLTYGGNVNAGTGAGTVTVTGRGGYKGTLTERFDIRRAELTITGAAVEAKMIGDDAAAAVTGVTFGGLVNNEALVLNTDYEAAGSYPDTNSVGAKNVPVTVTLKDTAKAGNYTLSGNTYTAAGSVTSKGVHDLTVPEAQTLAYGDVKTAAAASGTGGVITYASSDDTVVAVDSSGQLTAKKVGRAAITVTAAAGNAYTEAVKTFDVTVNAKAVTVKADAKTKTYGAAEPDLTYTVTPALVPGDSFTGALSRDPGEDAGTYAIGQGTLSAGDNYTITFQGAAFTIDKATPAVTAPTANLLTYNGTAQALVTAGSTTGGTLQYKLGSAGDYGTAIPAAADAGTYTVYYKAAGGTNYCDVAEASITVTVRQAPLTITAKPQTITYGESITQGTEQVGCEGLCGGDALAGITLTRDGTAIKPSAALVKKDGADVTANYRIHYVDGTATVNPKSISGAAIAAIPGQTYTGSAISPAVTVKDGGETLVLGADYTVAYSNNVNVGTAAVTVTGKGNYTGTKTAAFEITKAAQAALRISGDTASVVYGDTVELTASGGSGDGEAAWSVTDGPAAVDNDGTVTVTGTGEIKVKAVKSGGQNYEDAEDTLTFTAGKRPLAIAGAAVEGRQYDGTAAVTVSAVTLDGVVSGDTAADISVTADGTISGSNAGTYTSVTLSGLTLAGSKAANYVLANPGGVTVNAEVEISKADALTPNAGGLPVVNKQAHTYIYGLGSLRPAAPDGQSYGAAPVTYTLDEISLGSYYTEGAAVREQTLTLPIQEVDSETEGDIGTITVTIHSQNFEDMTAVITVRSSNKKLPFGAPVLSADSITYGQPLSTITLSGAMQAADDGGNEVEVPGAFAWSSPDIRPAVQDAYSAAWTFTPEDDAAYVTVHGTAAIRVEKAGQAALDIGGTPDAAVYGDTFALTASGGSGGGEVTWSAAGPVAVDENGRVTVTGVGEVEITAAKAGDANYEEASATVTFTAGPRPLAVTGADAAGRAYDGTDTVKVTAVEISGILDGDDVSVDVAGLTGTVGSANAGTYTSVVLPALTLTGTKADCYTVPAGEADTSVTISKATPEVAAPSGLEIISGAALSTVALPDGWAWDDPSATVSETGAFPATFTHADTANYNAVKQNLTVTVKTGHAHAWAAAWSSSDTHHWHACTAEGCDVTEDSGKDGYGEHTPGGWIIDREATSTTAGSRHKECTVCGHTTETERIPAEGGSFAGDHGAPSTPSTPPVTTGRDVESGRPETTATPSATVKGGTASSTVSSGVGDEIVKQAEANKSGNVVIAPEVKGGVSKTEVSIPSKTVEQLGRRTEASLTVSTPVADVTIPNEALGGLSESGGILKVTAERTGNSVELSVKAGSRALYSIPGGVKVTVPVDDATPGTVAVLVREDGTRQVIRKSTADKSSVTIPLEGSARVEIADNSKRFDDVPGTGWAADAVAFASSRELFSGTGKTTFSPERPMSRGMLAVVLHNLENNPRQTMTGVFDDVDNGKWYAEGVAWAAKKRIITGYGSGRFGPDDDITREQLAVMLWRYAGSPDASGSSLMSFADVDQVSAWAVEAMRWATERGVLNGKGNGVLDPGGKATRAETAQMLKNFMDM